ncbi:MAG: hypothetical protein V4734_01005 [Terriglobus sp.]
MPAFPQQRGTPVPPGTTNGQGYDPAKSGLPSGMPDDTALALDPSVIHRREEARKLDRKKRMVDSANRLLVLSQQLQADLKGREATPEDQRKLDEIAKLARQVKDQMRN